MNGAGKSRARQALFSPLPLSYLLGVDGIQADMRAYIQAASLLSCSRILLKLLITSQSV